MRKVNRGDIEKQNRWNRLIREAARSGNSIREFCRRRGIKESQFYWWQRRLKDVRKARGLKHRDRDGAAISGQATFALVSDPPGELEAGIELVLGNGSRLRIGKGVDEETLRTVLAAIEGEKC